MRIARRTQRAWHPVIDSCCVTGSSRSPTVSFPLDDRVGSGQQRVSELPGRVGFSENQRERYQAERIRFAKRAAPVPAARVTASAAAIAFV